MFCVVAFAQQKDVFFFFCDGKKYKTVKIGIKTWLAENLNYDAEGSVCYDNKSENCTKYGRLYNWPAARQACPKGWHLPSDAEWDVLIATAGEPPKDGQSSHRGYRGSDA
ncbi:MAG: hypothetical protein LBH25_14165 [Fibromonadaceae bacterium]|nr:hypothetical protein [Fibromonadaceae bacterium]